MKTLVAFAYFLAIASALAANWPAWRGPDGTGVSSDKNLPLQWDTNAHVRWRAELPGPGNSSPIVWGNQVFITQALKEGARRTLMCFDRATGKLLWQSGVTYTEREPTSPNNPYCSGTPATDGERVYVSFGSAGVLAYDFAGKEVWRRDLGKLVHMHGNAISPILYSNLCILYLGPGENAHLIALDKTTGQTAWDIAPPKGDASEQSMRGGFGRFGGRGRGGFGPGSMIASEMFSQADKNGDQKLTKQEFADLAETWFDKLDPDKTDKLSQAQWTDKFSSVLPSSQSFGPPPGQSPDDGPPRGPDFGPARFVGPVLFTAADADKDGTLTRTELKAAFAKWFNDWDADHSGSLTEEKLAAGLQAVLPRTGFGPRGQGGFGPTGEGRPGPGTDGSGGFGRRRGGFGGFGGPGGRGDFGGGGMGNPSGSWSTPVVIRAAGHDQLILNSPNRVAAYDPASGKLIWFSKGLGDTIYTTPLWGDGLVVAMSGSIMGATAIAVKPEGIGDVTDSQRPWRIDRVRSSVGSGIIYEGRFYTISQEGQVGCYDLKDGTRLWEQRLRGPGGRGSSWSSMLLADGKIYLPNQSGDVFVLRAGAQYELLATNSVHEPTNASLAAADGNLFLRTEKSLWCFANPRD